MQTSLANQEKKDKPSTDNKLQGVEKQIKSFPGFFSKFNNDWTMSFASGLAYNLMVAIVPIAVALIAALGYIIGSLSPETFVMVINHIQNVFPSTIASQNVLAPALTSLRSKAGILGLIALLTALFGGSRLFISLEAYFDIIYRTHTRTFIAQNIMAIGMIVVFILLTPVMILASSAPAFILSLVQSSVLSGLPGASGFLHNSFLVGAVSLIGSAAVAWILFEVIFMVVPNQRISFKNSWLGALVSAILLEIFLALFPFYITHFLGSYTGSVGFAIIFLLFFYYFAVILLLGAQVNAYFAEHISSLPNNIAVVLSDTFGHSTKTSTSTETVKLTEKEKKARQKKEANTSKETDQADASTNHNKGQAGLFKKKTPQPVLPAAQKKKTAKTGALVEALAGTALAFVVTVIRLRRK